MHPLPPPIFFFRGRNPSRNLRPPLLASRGKGPRVARAPPESDFSSASPILYKHGYADRGSGLGARWRVRTTYSWVPGTLPRSLVLNLHHRPPALQRRCSQIHRNHHSSQRSNRVRAASNQGVESSQDWLRKDGLAPPNPSQDWWSSEKNCNDVGNLKHQNG